MDDSQRVSILSEALPYIQSFKGRKIVIKYGGSIMEDEKLKKAKKSWNCILVSI